MYPQLPKKIGGSDQDQYAIMLSLQTGLVQKLEKVQSEVMEI